MRIIFATACLAALCGCTMGSGDGGKVRTEFAAIEDTRPVGEPVRCVNTVLTERTHVRSDGVIDFVMKNGRVLRNRLPSACPGLNAQQRISYRSVGNRLCSGDTVTVLIAGSSLNGPSCALGDFQEVEAIASR